MKNAIVVFADETCSTTVLPVCRELGLKVMLVCDPRRKSAMCESARLEGMCDRVELHPEKEGRGEFVARLREYSAGFGLICSYGRILWRELIDAFPYGVANVHGGRLPQYRGANVLQWQLINGEPEVDVTLHYVDEGVDTGPVIDRRVVKVGENDTAVDVREKCSAQIPDMLRAWLPRLAVGRVAAEPQDPALAKTWPRRHPEDGEINWSWTDGRIANLTRALVHPWPSPYYFDKNGEKVEIDGVLSADDVLRLRRRLGR